MVLLTPSNQRRENRKASKPLTLLKSYGCGRRALMSPSVAGCTSEQLQTLVLHLYASKSALFFIPSGFRAQWARRTPCPKPWKVSYSQILNLCTNFIQIFSRKLSNDSPCGEYNSGRPFCLIPTTLLFLSLFLILFLCCSVQAVAMSKDKARSWLQTSQVYSDFPVNLFELDLTPNFLCPLWLTVLQNACILTIMKWIPQNIVMSSGRLMRIIKSRGRRGAFSVLVIFYWCLLYSHLSIICLTLFSVLYFTVFIKSALKNRPRRDFPGSLLVKTPHFYCRGQESDPSWGTKIPPAVWYGQEKKKKQNPVPHTCIHFYHDSHY